MIFCRRLHRRLDTMQAVILTLAGKVKHMSQELADLTAAVNRSVQLQGAALVLIQKLAADLAAGQADPAALKALTDSLTASTDALQAGVAAVNPAPAEA